MGVLRIGCGADWRRLGAALLAALALPCPVAWAAPAADRAPRADSYTFAFHDADISQVAEQILGTTLGVTYSVDPAVTGKISFRIDQRLTRAQLLEAFEAVLSANGVAMVRNGDSLLLTPKSKAKEAATVRMSGPSVAQAGYEVVAVPLSFATPSEVAKALDTIGRSEMVVYTDDKLGLLLLGGTARELEAAQQTVRVLDQSGLSASKMRWFELEKAPAATVAQELQLILQGSGSAGVAVVPLKRLNGLLVFARTPQALDKVGEWIVKLDIVSKEEASSLWVYKPRNLAADALASTLNTVLGQAGVDSGSANPQPDSGGAAPAASSTPAQAVAASTSSSGQGGDNTVHVGVSKDANMLIISAPASRWIQIKRMLDEVDQRPGQVLIEASILEVTLGDDFRYGIDWAAVASSGRLKIASSGNATGAVAPSFPGLDITFINNDIKAAVSALKSVTEVEVISAPKLVTLDNHTAKLQVGDQVPVTTRAAQSATSADAPLVVTTEYRDTGVILNVTPRISGADEVVLTVDQEVSSVAKTTSSGIDSPTIQQRRLHGDLILKNGGTIALGGLISSTRSKGNSGAPFLKDIPLINLAFKTKSDETHRTELIVLMTARIMKDEGAAEHVMSDLLADMKEIQGRGLLKQ